MNPSVNLSIDISPFEVERYWKRGCMIRITFINGSYYCEPGKTLLKLKRDSWDRRIGVTRKTERRRLRANEIVTFMNISEDVHK